jgi:hypothetical protein
MQSVYCLLLVLDSTHDYRSLKLSKEGGVMALRLKPGSENKAYSGFKPGVIHKHLRCGVELITSIGAAGPEGQATFIFQTDHERWDATLLDEITNKAKTVNIPLEWLTYVP